MGECDTPQLKCVQPTSPLYCRNVHKTQSEHLTQTHVLPLIKLKM
jgi:hypothetical protein